MVEAIIYTGDQLMRMFARVASTVCTVAALATPMAGCAHHYHDDSVVAVSWSDSEEPYYERWEHETHRDHVAWESRNSGDQHAYWAWRHDHQ
jgi:hypothetical protein